MNELIYYLRLMFCYPMWLTTPKSQRKPKDEFLHGLMPHKHNYQRPKKGIAGMIYGCTHKGCNMYGSKTINNGNNQDI